MKISEAREKLKTARPDTVYSQKIFALEEGKEDNAIQEGRIKGPRRPWLKIADKCGKSYTQKNHLDIHLKSKIKVDKKVEDKEFYVGNIQNGALSLYIYEEILHDQSAADSLYKVLLEFYNKGGEINKFKSTDAYKEWRKHS